MRRIGLAGLLALLFMTVGFAVGAPIAGATNVVFGGFEIDGNLVDNSGPGDPIDWATPPPNLTNFTDGSGNKDDGFTNGSKELDPANWSCTTASAPGKDDILGGQIAFRRAPATTGHQYAYVDFTRKAVNGDAHVDYEFNKSGSGVNSSCGGLPMRTPGDVLISFDTNNGGATIDVVAYTWDGSNFVADAHAADNAVGAVNIPNTITGHTAGDFGEASIDLTNAIGEISCGEFSGVYMKTRSSTGINSALQDYTKRQPLNIGACPTSGVTKKQRDATTDTSGSAFTTSPITAGPGDFIEYQLAYTNSGPATAHNVVVTDTLASNYASITCSGATAPDTCTVAGQVVTASLGDVGPSATKTVTVRAQLSGSYVQGTSTTVTNAAAAKTKEDSASSNTVSLTVVTAKSGLKKEVRNVTTGGSFAATAVASPGDTLEYRLTYSNSGPGAVSGASVSDTIDSRTSFVPNPPTCTGCSVSGSTLTWNVGTLAGTTNPSLPTTKNVSFQVKLASTGFASGTSTAVDNTATGTSTGEPGTTSTTTTTVKTPSSSSVKAVRNVTAGQTSFATTTTAKPGDVLEYQITYTNGGPGTATNVVLTDTLAAKQTLVASTCASPCSASGQTLTWNLGTAAPGSQTFTFKVTLDNSFPAGSTDVKNTVVTTAGKETPPDTPPTTVTVTANPGSTLAKAVRNATTSGTFGSTADASAGDTLEYRLTYTNTGNAPATGVVVTDTLSSKQTLDTTTCSSPCSYNPTTRTLTWTVGTVAASAPPTVLTFKVALDSTFPSGASTPVTNTGSVDTDQEAPKDSNTTTVTVKTPNSSTVKAVRNVTTNGTFAATAAASPGDTIEYQLTYTNNGPGTATGETVVDTLAAMQTYGGSCTASTGTTCAFNAPKLTWTIGTVASGGTRTLTFQVKLDSSFPSGSTPVQNTAVYKSDQEPPTTTPPTTVTVTANPGSGTVKAVRNVTTNGSFADTATAKPGQVLEYRLTYTNTGNAPATGVVVTDTLSSKQTLDTTTCSSPCSYNPTTRTLTWTLGTVAANAPATVLTFKVTLDSSFSGTTTIVKNVATADTNEEQPKDSNTTSVTVVGTPKLTLVKAADKTKISAGDKVTYTLTYGNSGDSAATGSTITETVPDGTSYVSCTGGCTVSGSTVTWDVGTVNPGGGSSVTMTVQAKPDLNSCAVCNVATITSPDQAGTTSSNQVCAAAQPSSDPSTANAKGDAIGLRAYVPLLGIPLVNANISHAASTQTGVGTAADKDEFLHLDILGVVGLASVAKADVLRTTSGSEVTKALGAKQSTTSEVLGLNVLSGVVTADTVRSVASTSASGTASSYSAAGTTLTNLKVLGSSVVNPAPGAKIPLDNNLVNKALYGKGSYVAINEQTGSTSAPASGVLSGGTYKSDLTVTAIRVYITGGTVGVLLTGGGAPVEIAVAKAQAHSEHKQTTLCTTNPNNGVSGHAFVASAQVDPLVPTATVGFVDIPGSGGSAHMGVPATLLPADGGVLTTDDAASDSTGTNGATSSTSSSYAQAANVCLLKVAAPTCLVKATLVKSQSNSTASSGSRSSDATGTQFVDLVVAGIPISGTPPPNTTITLPLGLGYVVLNEQTPDAPETGHTGLTVRAIHIKLTTPLAPLLTGAEVIVAEAHSDALWR